VRLLVLALLVLALPFAHFDLFVTALTRQSDAATFLFVFLFLNQKTINFSDQIEKNNGKVTGRQKENFVILSCAIVMVVKNTKNEKNNFLCTVKSR